MLLKKILCVVLALILVASMPVTIFARYNGRSYYRTITTDEPETEDQSTKNNTQPIVRTLGLLRDEPTDEDDSVNDSSKQSTNQYTVKFFIDGIQYQDYEQTVNEGEKAVQPKDPIKLNLDFDDWYYEEDLGDLSKNPFSFDTPITGDIELYSQFTATVRFIANSSEVGSTKVIENGTVTEPKQPERAGYTFITWKSQQYGAFNFAEIRIVKHTDLFAQFLKDGGDDRYSGYWHYEGPDSAASIRGFNCPNCGYTAGNNVNYNHPFHLYFNTNTTNGNLALIVVKCIECKVISEWSPSSNKGASLAGPNAIPSGTKNMAIGGATLVAKYVTVQFLPGLDGFLLDNSGPYMVDLNGNSDNSWKIEWEPEVYAYEGATHIGWMEALDLEDELYPITGGFPDVVNKSYEFVAIYTKNHVVTVTAASSKRAYDGTALSNSKYEVENLPIGYTLTAKTEGLQIVEGAQTNVGSSVNSIIKNNIIIRNNAKEDVTQEFHIIAKNGTLTVTPRTVTLTSGTDSKVYDGTPLINKNVVVGGSGFIEGEGAEYDVIGTITDPGTADNAFTYTLNEGTIAANYTITKNYGKLTIAPRTDLSYEVNYLEKDTNKELWPQKIEEDQTFGEKVTEEAAEIDGYDQVAPTSVTFNVKLTDNVITFYYTVRTDLSYTVEYREGSETGAKLLEDKTVENMTFDQTYTEDAETIDGYNVDAAQKSMTITTGENKIVFVYTIRTDLSYTVEYRRGSETGTKLLDDKTVENKTFDQTYTEGAKRIGGYYVDTAKKSVTITTGENKIVFIYKASTRLSYTVEYREGSATGTALLADKKVPNRTFAQTYTEDAEAIDGYNVDAAKKSVTITTSENKIVFIYTARTDLSYTVEYREGSEKGTKLLDDKTVENKTFAETYTETAETIDGYTVDKAQKSVKITTVTTNGNKIVFIYTARTDLSYTVEYREGSETGTKLLDDKTIENKTFAQEYTEDAEAIDGYYVDEAQKAVTITTGENKIVFVYTARTDLSYTVEYREGSEAGTKLLDDKTVENKTFKQTYTEDAEAIDGYNVDEARKSVTITTGENKIVFIYTARTDLSYTVEYREGTETGLKLSADKTVDNRTFAQTYTEDAKKIDGYNVDKAQKSVTITTGENKIVFIYTARTDLSYTVEYREGSETGSQLLDDKTVENRTFAQTYTEDAETIDGYNVDAAQKSVTITTGENMIVFVYTARTDLSYTVEYREGSDTGSKLLDDKTVNNVTFAQTYTEDAASISGYNADAARKDVAITTGENKIVFVYTARTNLSYTVEYREGTETGSKLMDDKTVNNVTFDKTYTEDAEAIDGYNVDAAQKSVTIATGENKIVFVYTARTDLSYTVEYREGSETGSQLLDGKTVENRTFGQTYTEDAVTIDGYNADAAQKSVTITTGENKIVFIYTARTDLSYVVNYLEQGAGKTLAPQKTVNGQTLGAQATETAIDITGYNKVAPTSGTITIAVSGNVIDFYYTARNDLSYTVEYREGTAAGAKLFADKTVDNVTFGRTYTEDAVVIDGYIVDAARKSIMVGTGYNTIIFVYTVNSNIRVTFDSQGGITPDPVSIPVTYATQYGALATTSWNGYKFIGWFTTHDIGDDATLQNNENGYDEEITADTIVTKTIDHTLYARWALNEYTVTFVDWDGTVLKTETVAHGSDAVAPIYPIRNGYTFTKWDVPFNGITGDLTVTALYLPIIRGGGGGGGGGIITTIIFENELPMVDLLEMYEHRIYIQGYPDSTVRADRGITRAEVTTIFYRLLLDTYKDGNAESTFTDVPFGAWYSLAVATLADLGIITGYADGTFRPNDQITRAEFATVAARFDKLAPSERIDLSDVPVTHWAAKYIYSAFTKGWVSGYDDGTFRPNQIITRAEVAKIVNTMLNRLPEELPDGFMNPYSDIKDAHWAYIHMMEASTYHEYDRDDDGVEIWVMSISPVTGEEKWHITKIRTDTELENETDSDFDVDFSEE